MKVLPETVSPKDNLDLKKVTAYLARDRAVTFLYDN